MSNTTAKITLQITDNGDLKGIEKDALNANKQVSKLVANAKDMPKSSLMAKARGRTPEEMQYDQARASGGTGAAGRDFANQAQGLGGLVRLYATYAANIFAVGAAFRALSDAMNTTNMIKGLDQLGAASGQSLGTLAKQFTAASGGAISLREAMEATAKATSSGLSSKQFLQLGEVAKKASQALGVNMSDAVSRLTRGITKLEPELLDELGIFTKVGKATEDYARSVGKSVNALTDFERRQAFANAVLKEGTDKFSEINIPTNPYDQLLARLKDLSQTVLEVVNTALGPLISLLSSSPKTLLLILGAIGTTLIKQAIPALGEYKKQLSETAKWQQELYETRAAAAKKASDAAMVLSATEVKAEKEKIAEIRTAQVDAAEARLKAVSRRGLPKDVREILKKPTQEISTEELKNLESRTGKAAARYRELAAAIRASQQAEEAYAKTARRLDEMGKRDPSLLSAAGSARAKAEAGRKAAASSRIISESGETAAVDGFSTAIKESYKNIKTEKLGLLRTAYTGIGVAANLAAVGVSRLMTAVSSFLGAIGLFVGVYQILSAVLSKAGEESNKLEDSFTDLSSAAKTAADTAKRYEEQTTTASITAKANAFSQVADSIETANKSMEAWNSKAGVFEKSTNFLSKIYGGDRDSKFDENMSKAVTDMLLVLDDPKLKQEAETKLKSLLKIPSLDLESISDALDDLSREDKIKIFKQFSKDLEVFKNKTTSAVGALISVKEGFEDLDKTYVSLVNSLNNSDPLSTFGSKSIKQLYLIQEAFKDTRNQAGILNDILKDTNKIRMFSPETQASLLDAAKNLKVVNDTILKSQEELTLAQNKYNKAIEDLNNKNVSEATKKVIIVEKVKAEGQIAVASQKIDNANKTLASITSNLDSGFKKGISDSFKLIEAPLTRAYTQAGINFSKTLVDKLPKTAKTAEISGRLEVASLELQKQEILETRKLIEQLELNRLSGERLALEAKATQMAKDDNSSGADRRQISDSIARIKAQEDAIRDPFTGKRKTKAEVEAMPPEVAAIYQQRMGVAGKLAAISGQQNQALVNAQVQAVENIFSERDRGLQSQLEALLTKNELRRAENEEMPPEYRRSQELSMREEERVLQDALSFSGLLKELAVTNKVIEKLGSSKSQADKDIVTEAMRIRDDIIVPEIARKTETIASSRAKEELELTKKAEEDTKKASDEVLAKDNARLELVRELARVEREGVAQAKLNSIEYELAGLDAAKQSLEVQNSIGALTEDDYNIKKQGLELLQNELNYQKEILDATNKRIEAEVTASARLRENFNKLGDTTAFDIYNEELAAINRNSAAQIKLAEIRKATGDAQARSLTLQNEKTKKMEEIFTSSVDNMTDALIEFAMTGKQSFGDMIKNMILDIAKLEFKMSMQKMWKGSGGFGGNASGEGLIGNVLKLVGFGPKADSLSNYATIGGTPPVYAKGGAFDTGIQKFAKGDAFDAGIQKFAKGGSFTNSVVSSPTLFKFAKGTGMMGEAGPEAIMPLKRGKDGALGVAATSPSSTTSVVVNNYGKEEATVTESVDSRGNRRVEVMIGDMVAGEMQRSGSMAQQSIRNTFGKAPALIRR